MKNHIKNYIKIMGLEAVSFGTAQVDGVPFEYEIRVKKVEGNNVRSFCIDVNYLSRTKTRVHDRKVVVWQKHGDCSLYVRGDWNGDSFVRLCDVISASPVPCPGVEAKSEYKVSFTIRQGGVWFDEAVIFEMYFLSDDVENKNVGGTLRRRR